ncbi:patatin-like phospholipase family protein [Nocardia sp. NPDC004123]
MKSTSSNTITAQPLTKCGTALVLGGGGAVGLMWMAGVVIGLAKAGIDLARADRIVGTSAGSITGCVIAGGLDPMRLVTPPEPTDERLEPQPDPNSPAVRIAQLGSLIGLSAWPDKELLITAIDVVTKQRQVWTASGPASPAEAVAASTATPGAGAPVPIDGASYVDGGMHSTINADLAAGAQQILIIEPLAHLYPHAPADSELGGATTMFIVPETAAVIGPDLFDPAGFEPAFHTGLRQAADHAAAVRQMWPAA